jgi:hypothetical protein
MSGRRHSIRGKDVRVLANLRSPATTLPRPSGPWTCWSYAIWNEWAANDVATTVRRAAARNVMSAVIIRRLDLLDGACVYSSTTIRMALPAKAAVSTQRTGSRSAVMDTNSDACSAVCGRLRPLHLDVNAFSTIPSKRSDDRERTRARLVEPHNAATWDRQQVAAQNHRLWWRYP